MGMDDTCDTTLVLGLGLSVKDDQRWIKTRDFEPCLSLGLSEGPLDETKRVNNQRSILSRQESVTSSFCNGVVKREREVGGSEEVERVSSKVSDEDDDLSNTRKKLRLNKDQSVVLEESFKEHSTLNPKQKQELARKLNLRARQVEVWFQNRRARTKLKQTEIDCEFLKKCCETLSDENQRLQKEIQELKSSKLAHPLYMHVPAATLTMCPSCERISGTGGDNKPPKTSLITVSPKAHFHKNLN